MRLRKSTLPRGEMPEILSSCEKTTLPNGVRILSEFVPTVQSFSLGIWIDAGSRDESPEYEGIAHFIEHTVFRGSATRSQREIANAFELFGGYVNAFTTKEQTCFYVRALVEHFKRAFDLLSDVVLHPKFRPADIEKERAIIIEEIKSVEDEPEELIFEQADTLLFGTHALAHPIAGSAETLANIHAEDIANFHRENLHGGKVLIAVAGNIPHELALALADKHFGDLPSGNAPERTLPTFFAPKYRDFRKPIQQSHVLFTVPTSGATSADNYTFAVTNMLLGDGMSSRLNQSIREKRGIAYSVYSSLEQMKDCGTLSIYAALEKSNLEKTESLIQKEIELLSQKFVQKNELRRAKEQLKTGVLMSLESMSGRMNGLARSELYFGRNEEVSETLAAVEAVSEADILALMSRTATWEKWQKITLLNQTKRRTKAE